MKKLSKKHDIYFTKTNCKLQSIEKQTGSNVIRANFKYSNSTYTILCSQDFEQELNKVKELDSSCKLVFKQYKKHSPYLVSLEVIK